MWRFYVVFLLFCLATGTVNSRNLLLEIKEFMEQKVEQTERSDLPPVCDLSATSELNLCWLCDAGCQEHINRIPDYKNPTQDYFTAVTEKISEILQDLDSGMRVLNGGVTLLAESISIMDYTSSKDTAGLAAANTAIWAEGGRFTEFKSRQCDSAFMLASPDDAGFSGGVIAVSNMMRMCTATASGLAKYYRDVGNMATVVAHELGHQMGIYHDGVLNSAYTTSPLRPRFPDEFAAMDASCTAATPQNLVMDEVPINVEPVFSSCSKAYYAMWRKLSTSFPTFYPDSCLTPAERRRSVRSEGASDVEEAGIITDHGIITHI